MSTTQVEAMPKTAFMRTSSRSSTLPPEYDEGNTIELGTLTPESSTGSLPQYEAAVEAGSSSAAASDFNFYATHLFQIETTGHPLIALPIPPKPVPIPVYTVLPTGTVSDLAYESHRATRASGNCVLVRPGTDEPLCTTTYRFGPNRPPRIQLHGGAHEEFEVHGKGCTTRAQTIRTHLGTFQWRYATRAERRAAGGVDSLVVLDQVHKVALAGGRKTEERRRKVAQLVRSEALRSEGSRRSTAGNGGRLMMDLREWAGGKGEAAQMEAFVVASCLMMLKKEVDRRRMHQTIVIMAGASGGS